MVASYTFTADVSDAAGNAATQATSSSFTVDTTLPTVSIVTSSDVNGSYKADDTLDLSVIFSETVTVNTDNGTPQLTLTVGDNSTYPVNYSSGSGTLSLNFAYTVQAGHNSSDLDYAATTSLGANGATIVDVAGNSATLTLASPGATNSLGSARNYVIDTTSPTMTITVSPDVDGSTSNDGTLAVTFISDEATTNFVSGDVIVTNGSINDTFAASGNAGTYIYSNIYTCSVWSDYDKS
jgi:hypothetical protein